MQQQHELIRRQSLCLGLIALLAGIAYYWLFRNIGADVWPGYLHKRPGLIDPTAGAFPSFIHMVIFTLLSVSLFGATRRNVLALAAMCLMMTLGGEFVVGHYDRADVIAAIVGFALPTIWYLDRVPPSSSSHRVAGSVSVTHSLLASLLLAGSAAFIMGTSRPCDEGSSSDDCSRSFRGTVANPVYLSYQDLRNSVVIEGPRDLEAIGRVYLYQNHIFLNQRNTGIHILDNTDSSSPVNVGFIAIPGNTEVNIADNNLYADSYIDLLTFDISNLSNIFLVAREQDIFPFDAYQNIPADIRFRLSDIDESRGVIVSHE